MKFEGRRFVVKIGEEALLASGASQKNFLCPSRSPPHNCRQLLEGTLSMTVPIDDNIRGGQPAQS